MREIVQSEIQAKAEAKIPNYEEGQKKYAKQYRINIHQWSYGRLIESIKTQASKLGIAIEFGKQSVRGSPQENAQELAIAAYNSRSGSIISPTNSYLENQIRIINSAAVHVFNLCIVKNVG
jgi:hypothetical protein